MLYLVLDSENEMLKIVESSDLFININILHCR